MGRTRALLLASLVLSMLPADAMANDDSPDVAQTQTVAAVRLEVRQEDGQVLEYDAEFDWNQASSLEFEAGGRKHGVLATFGREDQSAKKVEAAFHYKRDGKSLINVSDVSLKLGSRRVLRGPEGFAIALTVRSAKPQPEEQPEKRPPIDAPDEGEIENPLDGLDGPQAPQSK